MTKRGLKFGGELVWKVRALGSGDPIPHFEFRELRRVIASAGRGLDSAARAELDFFPGCEPCALISKPFPQSTEHWPTIFSQTRFSNPWGICDAALRVGRDHILSKAHSSGMTCFKVQIPTGAGFFFFFLIHMFVFRQSDYLLHRSEGLVPYASA